MAIENGHEPGACGEADSEQIGSRHSTANDPIQGEFAGKYGEGSVAGLRVKRGEARAVIIER